MSTNMSTLDCNSYSRRRLHLWAVLTKFHLSGRQVVMLVPYQQWNRARRGKARVPLGVAILHQCDTRKVYLHKLEMTKKEMKVLV